MNQPNWDECPEWVDGRMAFLSGQARDENPFAPPPGMVPNAAYFLWESGWDWEKRRRDKGVVEAMAKDRALPRRKL